MSAYLVVAGDGFIGSHLVRSLIRRGEDVHILASPSTDLSRLADIAEEVTIHTGDLADASTLSPVFAAARPDRVVHLSATTRPLGKGSMLEDTKCALSDVSDLINVLSAAEDAVRPPALFMRTGTLAEYGKGPHPYAETQREQPTTPYAAGMISATHFADVLQHQLSFPVISARLALVYGPGQSSKFLIPQLIENCRSNLTTHVRYPDERRDLIHINDVVSAMIQLTDRPPVNHRTINIATGVSPTMREVAELVLRFTGAPETAITFGSGIGPNSVSYLQGSAALMRELYGWSARIGIADGLSDLVDSHKESSSTQADPQAQSRREEALA